MTLLDLILGILIPIISIDAFIGISKLGFEKYAIGRGFAMWVFFAFKAVAIIYATSHFLLRINWDYVIY